MIVLGFDTATLSTAVGLRLDDGDTLQARDDPAPAGSPGHATRLLQAALAEVGDYPCRINAQIYLTDMYAHHGFVPDGDEFLEDGIPHVPMLHSGPSTRPAACEAGPA